jgi:hypothetical protein
LGRQIEEIPASEFAVMPYPINAKIYIQFVFSLKDAIAKWLSENFHKKIRKTLIFNSF